MKTIKIKDKSYSIALIYLTNELNEELKNVDCDNIVSNGNICYALQESMGQKPTVPNLIKGQNYYNLGNYNDKQLFVNVMQLWTDNKIYLRKGDDIVTEILVDDSGSILI